MCIGSLHPSIPSFSHGVWTTTPALTEDQQIAVCSLAGVGRSAHFVTWHFARGTMLQDQCSMSVVARLHLLDYVSQCAGPHVFRDSWNKLDLPEWPFPHSTLFVHATLPRNFLAWNISVDVNLWWKGFVRSPAIDKSTTCKPTCAICIYIIIYLYIIYLQIMEPKPRRAQRACASGLHWKHFPMLCIVSQPQWASHECNN